MSATATILMLPLTVFSGSLPSLGAVDYRPNLVPPDGFSRRDEYLQARDDLRGSAEATTQVIPPNAEPEPA
jgi:hypothetical protein